MGYLHNAFAVGSGTDRFCNTVIAQCLCEQLCCTGSIFIGQDNHRLIDAVCIRCTENFGGTITISCGCNGAFRQQHIQHLDGWINQTAGIVSQVKDQGLCSLVADQIFYRFFKLVIGVFIKIDNFDVASSADHFWIYSRGYNNTAGNLGDFTILVVAADGQAELGARFAANLTDGVIIGVCGDVDVVYLDDQVTRFDVCLSSRRIRINFCYLNKSAFAASCADTDTNQFTCVFLLKFRILGSRIIGSILIGESGDISHRDIVIQGCFIDCTVIVLSYVTVNLGKFVIHRFSLGNVGDGSGEHLPGKNHGNGKCYRGDDEHKGKGQPQGNFLVHNIAPNS